MPAPSSSPIHPVLTQLVTAADVGRIAATGVVAALAKVPDPRARRGVRHQISVILVLAACANQQTETVRQQLIIAFRRYGMPERLITDNGSPYVSAAHAIACRALGIRHLRTRPYRPQTNGKAERFIRTMLGGWAYGAIYRDSAERNAALAGWLDFYNRRRPHGALRGCLKRGWAARGESWPD